MAGVDVGKLFSDFSGVYESLVGQQDEALKNVQQLQTEAAVAAARGTDARGFTALQVQTEGLAKLEAQNYIQDYLGNLDYRAQMAELAQAHRAVSAQGIALQSKLAQEASVTIFDDPLQAIVNAFTMPWTQQALAAKSGEADVITKTMDEMNRLATNTAHATLATAQTVTTASIADATAATAANIERMRLEYDAKAAVTNAHRVERVMNASKEQLDMQLKVEGIEEQRKARDMQSQMLQLQLGKIKDEALANKFDLALVQAGARDIGGTSVEWTEDMLLNRKLAGDPLVGMLRERGWQLKFTNTKDSELPLGKDPADTEIRQARLGLLHPDNEDTQRILKVREEAKQILIKAHGGDAKKVQEAWGEQFKKGLEELETWKPGDNTNPMRPATWAQVAGQSHVKSDPLWQKYVAPQITASNELTPLNPEELVKILVQNARKDGVSPTQINDLVGMAMATSTVLNNNQNRVEFYASGWKQTHLNIKSESFGRPNPPGAFAAIPGSGQALAAVIQFANAAYPSFPTTTDWLNEAQRAAYITAAIVRAE